MAMASGNVGFGLGKSMPALIFGITMSIVVAAVIAFLPWDGLSLAIASVAVAAIGFVTATRHFSYFVLCCLFLVVILPGSADAQTVTATSLASDMLGALFVAAATGWLISDTFLRGWSWPSPLALSFGGLTIAALASTTASCCPAVTLAATIKVLSAFLMLATMERLVARDVTLAARVAAFLFAGSAVSIVIAYIQQASPAGPDGSEDSRVSGLMAHPNLFGTHLVIMILVAVSLTGVYKRWRIALWLYTVFAGGALLFTLSRTAWIALVGGIVVIGFLRYRWVLPLLLLGLPLAVIGLPVVQERFSDINISEAAESVAPVEAQDRFYPDNTLEWRIAYWTRVLPLVEGQALTGTGLESVAQVRPEGMPPHNEFVRTFVEMGWFGLVTFIAVLIAGLGTAISALRGKPSSRQRAFVTAYCACAVAVAIRLPVENQLTDVPNLWSFAAIAAITTAQLLRTARPREQREDSLA